MPHGRATWTPPTRDFDSLRTVHRKLVLRAVGFRRKRCIGQHDALPQGAVPEMTHFLACGRAIRKRQLLSGGGVVMQDETRIPTCIISSGSPHKGLMRVGSLLYTGDTALRTTLHAFRASCVSGEGKTRVWFAYETYRGQRRTRFGPPLPRT